MRRCLVTGARGFVGRHLTATLTDAFPDADIVPFDGDVTDAAAMARAVAVAAPNACVHLAAIAAVPQAQSDPDSAWRVNLHGTLNLARAIQAEAPECLLVFASSAEAYGLSFRAGEALNEHAALAPANTYAATKAAADLALGAMAQTGLRVVRLRAFNHTGPGQSDAYVVAAFARQVARIEAGLQPPVIAVGNLDARRDFLDVRDVCAAYAACCRLGAAMPGGSVLNIASGTTRRVGDVLETLLGLSRVRVAIQPDPARMRPSDTPVAAGDAAHARALLGWAPRIPWETTVSDVLEDWRARVS